MSDGGRIQELEARLAEFSAALGRERAERERASHERDEYKKLYELVMLELERVKRHLRAQNKSERVDAQQVQLAFAEVAKLIVPPELAQAIADQENEQASTPERETEASDKRRGAHGRGKVPEHLPVERIEVEPPAALRSCLCCGQAKVKIGEETTDRLDFRPASLVHVQIARIKYAPTCKCEEGGVVIASVPDAAPVDPCPRRSRRCPGTRLPRPLSQCERSRPRGSALRCASARKRPTTTHTTRSTGCEAARSKRGCYRDLPDGSGKRKATFLSQVAAGPVCHDGEALFFLRGFRFRGAVRSETGCVGAVFAVIGRCPSHHSA